MTPSLEVRAAYDEALLKTYPYTSEEDAFARLARAHAVYSDRSRWLSPHERIAILERVASLIEARTEELTLQAAREGGKPYADSKVEIVRAISGVKKAVEAIAQLRGEEIPMNQNAASEGRWAVTYREPRGVVLAVSAFNHPFNLLVHQAITAVAAGCPVLVKPATTTPMSCESLVSMLHEAGLAEDHAQMILTENEVTSKLVADERVSFLTFIGSARVGWMLRSKLAAGAACALEHGGVAPAILDETADLDDALPRIAKGAFYHAGQVCVSVQRLFVHRSIVTEVSERLAAAASALKVGDPTSPDTEVGPLIRTAEVDRVHAWVEEARQRGAAVLTGGEKLTPTTYAPTVVMDPADDVRLSREEVFGPVLCIYPYDDIEEAVRRANLPDAYFQAALFTNRLDRALDIGRRLHGMAVMINDHTAFRVDWMPFGGHRHSGLALGGIEHSMRDMSLERMIVFRG
ncbi:MAG: aldehyde dehydrogenase family protein [Myxococcota bacterium]